MDVGGSCERWRVRDADDARVLGALVRDGGAVMSMMRGVVWLLGAVVRDADDGRGSA